MNYNEENFILLDNQYKLFSCLLKNPNLICNVDPFLFKDSIFYDEFIKLKNLKNDMTYIDEAICNDIVDSKVIEDIYSNDSIDKVNPLNAEYYKKQIKNQLMKIEVLRLTEGLQLGLFNKNNEFELSDYEVFRNKLTLLLDYIKGSDSTITSINDLLDDYNEEIERRRNGGFYSYGDSKLDNVTVGALPGTITTIFGATGSGKSAYALSLFNKQINMKIPTMYFSLEMDRISTLDRLIAMRSRISINYIYMRDSISDDFNKSIVDEIKETENDLKSYSSKFSILDKPGMSLDELEYYIEKEKQRMNTNYAIVIIDLWTMVKEASTAEAKEIEKAINKTHEIAKRTNCHFILVVQANRELDNKKPASYEDVERLFAIRTTRYIKNSAAIEERSRCILGLWRPKYWTKTYFPDDERNEVEDDIMNISLLKANQMDTGKIVKYLFIPECMLLLPYQNEDKEEDNENTDDEI